MIKRFTAWNAPTCVVANLPVGNGGTYIPHEHVMEVVSQILEAYTQHTGYHYTLTCEELV